MSRRRVEVECLACGSKFMSILRWEGIPEKDYCTAACEEEDLLEQRTFEKFHKGAKNSEW